MMVKRQYAVVVAATVCMCSAVVSGARADLKLEQTVTTSGVPKQDMGKTTTAKPTTEKTVTYYKNGKQRIEGTDQVIIHDAVNEKTFILDPKKKTFYEVPPAGSVVTDDSDPMAEMMKMAELNGDVVVTDLKEEKSILGKTARHYSYVMTLKFSIKDPKAPAMVAGFLPTFVTTGDQWTVDVPGSSAFAKRSTQAAFEGLPSGPGKNFKTVMEKMATMKGIPLEGTQSSKTSFGELPVAGLNARMPKEPTVRQTKTTSLSEEPLPDSLFVVPTDYKKIAAPKVQDKPEE
ncbi:MAG: hypothetical protein H8F28_21945 [Fibrella sp.]|nr:hypothetical protein [Armatimonadota bacterium]